ncbi:acyltransferase [Paenibacillus sp. R14(2021)]|uniref:acyltransferase n=1 Tax=Paenibacillus sp. R14(2021) TaxID=2859228 RepID=UPI001C612676|nr:acyltransferase [Paenibacillus sp. R14(2021)]
MIRRERIADLDLMRGIAILAVVAIHMTSYATAFLPVDSILYPVYFVLNAGSHFAVPAFLFLSALLLFYHYDGAAGIKWLPFYRKRVQRIAVPYLFWSVIFSAAVFYIQRTPLQEGFYRFLKGLPYGGSYEHLYFILIIAQFYAIFPCLLLLSRVKWVSRHPLLAGAGLQVCMYVLNYYMLHMSRSGSFIGTYSLYLFLGIYAAKQLKTAEHAATKQARPASFSVLLAGFLLAGAAYVGQMWLQKTTPHWLPQPYLSYVHFASDYSYAAISCLFLLRAASLFGSNGAARAGLRSLGRHAFGIYFMHPLVLLLWRSKVMNNGAITYHLLTWTGGLAALLLSWAGTAAIARTRLAPFVIGEPRHEQSRSLFGFMRKIKYRGLGG